MYSCKFIKVAGIKHFLDKSMLTGMNIYAKAQILLMIWVHELCLQVFILAI